MAKASECVKVIVRVRPFNQKEKDNGSKPCVNIDEKQNTVELLKVGENEVKQFAYDYVFGMHTKQSLIYERSAFSLVESVVDGYNGTIFAYGQTGCGKTFTMTGVPENEEMKGIIPRSFQQIQTIIDTNSDPKKKFLVLVSFLEIYNEEIRDLLGKDHKARLDLKEQQGSVTVKDLTKVTVKTATDMDKYMTIGQNNRSVGATAMNAQSSRSHCIFTVYVESQVVNAQGKEFIRQGKLNLVDLAGSERQSKTQAQGDRLKEATKINLSLSALGNVISALVDGKTQHIPYRDSKLTRLLQDSLGGNTKTIMITALSPADYNYDETLSSLRYASRAKMIKNQPKVNEDPKDALLRQQADEIQKLKDQLSKMKDQKPGSEQQIQRTSGQSFYGNLKNQQEAEAIDKAKAVEVQKELEKLKAENDRLVKERQEKEEQMSRQKQRELEQIIQDNQKLQQEKEKILKQIAEKEVQAEEELKVRQQLEQLIKEKETMMVTGGKASEDDKKKYILQQKKLKKQLQEHEKLIEEREKQWDELYDLDNKYQNQQQEVDAIRKKALKLRKAHKEAISEIKDIQKENELDRQELLESIRTLERENLLYYKILLNIFKDDELKSLRGDCVYDEDKNDYKIPPFIFKQNKVNYPNLPYKEATEYIESLKDSRSFEMNLKLEQQDTPLRAGSRNRQESKEKLSRKEQLLREHQQQIQELEKQYPDLDKQFPAQIPKTPTSVRRQSGQRLSPINNRPVSKEQSDSNLFRQSPLKKEPIEYSKPNLKIPQGKLPPTDLDRKNFRK